MSKRDKDLDRIDATVFSSDALFDDEYRAELKHFCKRWLKEIVEHEHPNEITKAPTIEVDSSEAVAWRYTTNKVHTWIAEVKPPDDAYDEGSLIPLFTSPQKQWVELTDEQMKKIINDDASWTGLANPARVAKAISNALKEVNNG